MVDQLINPISHRRGGGRGCSDRFTVILILILILILIPILILILILIL